MGWGRVVGVRCVVQILFIHMYEMPAELGLVPAHMRFQDLSMLCRLT
jgi:hypothetical protein